jgi:hypothetical protein
MAAPRKRYCPKGHDTYVVGRTRGRFCRACFMAYIRRYRRRQARARRRA